MASLKAILDEPSMGGYQSRKSIIQDISHKAQLCLQMTSFMDINKTKKVNVFVGDK